jgi:hypothetical protein
MVILLLGGCVGAPASPPQLSALLATRSIASEAARYCPDLGHRTPVLAASNSTVAKLRKLKFDTANWEGLLTRSTQHSSGSTYAAICIFSTKYHPGFHLSGSVFAWWRMKNGSDGIITNWSQ